MERCVFPTPGGPRKTTFSLLCIYLIVIRSALMRGMISSGLMKKYSLERMLLELEKLHVIEDQSGNLVDLERTRKQKDILEALDKISWW